MGHGGHGGGGHGGGHHGGGGGHHHGGGGGSGPAWWGGGSDWSLPAYAEVVVPIASCPSTYSPVRATDNRVYDNECLARAAGENVVSRIPPAKLGDIGSGTATPLESAALSVLTMFQNDKIGPLFTDGGIRPAGWALFAGVVGGVGYGAYRLLRKKR